MTLVTLFLTTLCAPAESMIEDFAGGIDAWGVMLQYGDWQHSIASADAGALRIDYDWTAEGTTHVVYYKAVDLDLSWASSVSFEVKGAGDPVMVFLFLIDDRDRHRIYGPHGANHDFHSGYGEPHTCTADLERDRAVADTGVDLSRIRRVGLMLNQNGRRKGTVWLDNVRYAESAGAATLSPAAITPNGDGVYDSVTIEVRPPRGSTFTVEVLDDAGRVVATPAKERPAERGRMTVEWDGRADDRALPAGTYTVRTTCRGEEVAVVEKELTIVERPAWPPVTYEAAPVFPVGVWFEGAPSMAGYATDPAGAKVYYDRAFADLKAHHFDTVAVPNCPESLWETLLESAGRNGINVILEVQPLVALVSRPEPVSEAEAYEVCRRVHEKIGGFRSLLRYQIRDEPPYWMIPNWLLVQRIMAAIDPTRPTFSCFCHPDSLTRLAATATLSEAVFDVYPLRQGTPPQTLGGFLPTFGVFKQAAGRNRLWAVIQSFGITHEPNSWRYPTPEELRAQVYLSLAEGAQGVFFFIYSHMPGYLDGLVAADGTPQPLYATAAELANQLQRLAPLLLELKTAEPVSFEGDARVGSFTDSRGRRVLIVASTRPDRAVSVTVDTAGAWRDALSGESITARDGRLTVSLAAGAGCVLTME